MTKRLSSEVKKQRKAERREARKKEAASQVAATPAPAQPVNLCDDCAYEFGECEGVPKFGEGEGADNVVECRAFVNVANMPTADKATAPSLATTPFDEALKRLDEFGQSILNARASEIRELAEAEMNLRFAPRMEPTAEERAEVLVHIVQETIKREGGPSDGLVHIQEIEGAIEEEKAEDRAAMDADLEALRRHTQRFYQEEDFGTCQSCGQPLKRTALNRDRDAVRCTNGHCRQYRFIIKTISTGV